MLTSQQLQKCVSRLTRARAEILAPVLDAAMTEFGITSRTEIASFLAQVGHESLDFKFSVENLNYSASRLLQIFGKYFNASTAQTFAHNPAMIANRVYANRMGNGNEQSGDGWRFRGRCPVQATGREMYQWLTSKLGVDCVNNPDLLRDEKIGIRAAAAIFAVNKRCLSLCRELTGKGDKADLATFDRITKRINGGYNGRADRQARYLKALVNLPKNAPASLVAVSGVAEPVVAEPQPGATHVVTENTQIKDFSNKYLKHTPLDSAKNVAMVATARVGAASAFVWSLGLTGKILFALLILAVIAPVIWAIYVYRLRLWGWTKDIFAGLVE